MVSFAQQDEIDNGEQRPKAARRSAGQKQRPDRLIVNDKKSVDAERKEKSTTSILDFLDQGNIVDELPNDCATKILGLYDDARSSMEEWLKKYKKALRLAKLQPKESKKTFPFEGASTAMAPFVLEAMIDFNARSAPELAYSDNIVKAKIWGGKTLPDVPPPPQPQPGEQVDPQIIERATQAFQQAQQQREEAQERIDTEKEDRASRVAEYSNYQLSELMPMWKRAQDKLLMSLPCVGTMYKKTYFDSDTQEVCSDLCYGDQIIFDQAYDTFEDAPDYFDPLSPMTKNEVIEKIRGEDEWAIDETDLSDNDDTYELIECYTWVDVDKDGLKEPYCITIWKDKEKCVYARPLFDEDTVSEEGELIIKVEAVTVFTQYQFIPDPEGGPMGMGWGILLGPTFEEINKNIRQMNDAGTLQVLASNSGIIADSAGSGARGNRAKRGPIEVAMGKLTPVAVGGSGRLDIVQFPAAGPSAELFSLLGYMVDAVRRLTDASSQVDSHAGEAAALYLARLQQTLKRPNIIIMRVYDCAAREFKLIHEANFKHFSDDKYNRIIDDEVVRSMSDDFNPEDCDIRLVADPSQGSDLERIARAETVLQNAKTEQQPITNMRQATIDYYKVLGVVDVDILVPEPQGPDPMQAMMERQQQMDAAKEAMDAEFKQRDQQLRERGQNLQEAKMQLEGMKQQLEAHKEMQAMGIEMDESEADIVLKYSQAFKNLAEINATGVAAQAQAIENQFINNSEGGVPNGESATAPSSNPRANPALGS